MAKTRNVRKPVMTTEEFHTYLRNTAPVNIKAISRGAKRTIKPQTYSGTGNLAGLIAQNFPKMPLPIKKALMESVLQIAEKTNDGVIMSEAELREYVLGVNHSSKVRPTQPSSFQTNRHVTMSDSRH